MSQQDRAFMTSFMGVLAVLVVIAFVFYFIAQSVTSSEGDSGPNSRMEAKIQDNIAPVADVVVAETSAGDDTAPRAPRAGSEVFTAHCAACHNTGVAGAPKVGDKAAWAPRVDQGLDTLLTHATNGLNAMPPMGTCADCSAQELENAIVHMLEETGIKVASASKPAAAAPAAAPAQTASANGQAIYQASCFACHGTGAAGAPKTGDKAAWAPRIEKGMDTLMNHAINGFNAMPPKGTCFNCSDADLKAAVEYMIAESK